MIVASFVVLAQSFTCVVMVSKTCPDAKENVLSKGCDVKKWVLSNKQSAGV